MLGLSRQGLYYQQVAGFTFSFSEIDIDSEWLLGFDRSFFNNRGALNPRPRPSPLFQIPTPSGTLLRLDSCYSYGTYSTKIQRLVKRIVGWDLGLSATRRAGGDSKRHRKTGDSTSQGVCSARNPLPALTRIRPADSMNRESLVVSEPSTGQRASVLSSNGFSGPKGTACGRRGSRLRKSGDESTGA